MGEGGTGELLVICCVCVNACECVCALMLFEKRGGVGLTAARVLVALSRRACTRSAREL